MVSYKITAFVSITFTDNYNEEHKASCFFNSKAQVACFGNPYNLESNKNTKVIDCWNKTIRF